MKRLIVILILCLMFATTVRGIEIKGNLSVTGDTTKTDSIYSHTDPVNIAPYIHKNNAFYLWGIEIDTTGITDNCILKYDAGGGTFDLEADAAGTDGQNADSIMGKAISIIPPTDNYILKWDAGADSLKWEEDGGVGINWTDTIDVLLTVSDSAVTSGYIASKLNIADTASFANQFALKPSWTDTGAILVTVSDTTVTSGYIASKLAISDTASFSNQFALKLNISDTASFANQFALKPSWSDTGTTLITVSDTTVTSAYIATKLAISDTASFSNQFALKLAIADTAPLHNQIVLKLNIADTASFANQLALKAALTDTTILHNQIYARADSSTALYWPDTTLNIATLTDILTPSLQGNKQLVFAIDNPKNLVHDSTFIWTNRTGHTFTIDSVYSIARQDDYDYDLVESSTVGGTVTLIESITVTQNGTGWFWESVTDIDHAAIQTGMGILFVQSADSTDNVTCTIYGRYTD